MLQKIVMIVLIIVVLVFGGFYAYNELMPSQEVSGEKVIQYATVPVEKGDINVGVDTAGRIMGSWGGGIEVPGQRYGRISVNYIVDEVLIKEGQAVKKDEVLIKLKSPDLDAKLKEAKDKLRKQVDELSAMTGVSENNLEKINPAQGITIKAPIDGRITMLETKEGKELKQGDLVTNIVNDSKYKIRAKVTPQEYKTITKGQEVELRINNYEGTYKATIVEIDKNKVPDVDKDGNASGFIHWVSIEGENPGLIQPKMTARIGLRKEDSITYFVHDATIEGFKEEKRVLNRAKGIVTKVFVHNMDVVKKGDNIISMAGEEMQRSIQYKIESIRDIRKEIAEYQNAYSNFNIKAAMNGVIEYIDSDAKKGKTVRVGQYLAGIYNTNDMYMTAYVDDTEVLHIKEEAPVEVKVDAMPGEVFKGVVKGVENSRGDDKGTTRYKVRINVEGNDKLKPNFQAKAHIDAGTSKDTLLIPREGLLEEDGKMVVEVLRKDNTVEVVQVKVGLMNDKMVEILEGLKEGDKVITGSSDDVLPSQHIKSDDSLLPGKDKKDNSDNKGDKKGE
ncbi:efflux RND transporter periplasmic adaptor subunit [Clostridiaceae bacterium M8S5]|nr:efflux RND transporter periplasmic adaptor subunit [Clostridiaceae bacterium M8S5]